MNQIIWAVVWFAVISAALGIVLAVASKIFAVKTDDRVFQINALLPGANCGGCGYTGCEALANAIVEGKAPCNACSVCSSENIEEISKIMGVKAENAVRHRAQVMCSGTNELAKKKYLYEGVHDCVAANRLAGGDKLCPYGCIGLGTCAAACKFDAIHIINGVAAVDYEKCVACGACVHSCPKNIIKLIPYDAKHWVGCMSQDKGPVIKNYCDIGCIACRLCEKACAFSAITVKNNIAEIDYERCTGCGECEKACPRKVIWSGITQKKEGVVRTK